MAATPEKLVKTKVVKVLEAEDVYYFFPATGGYGRSGVPDIVCCVNGLFMGIECKANGGKPTALQVRELERIRRRNGVAVVVDENNLDMLLPLVRKLKGTVIKGAE
jgi:hypothetical protein